MDLVLHGMILVDDCELTELVLKFARRAGLKLKLTDDIIANSLVHIMKMNENHIDCRIVRLLIDHGVLLVADSHAVKEQKQNANYVEMAGSIKEKDTTFDWPASFGTAMRKLSVLDYIELLAVKLRHQPTMA